METQYRQMMQKARDKLRELRALHDDGLLSEQEFERRKNAILDAEYAPPGAAPAPGALPVRQGTELGFMTGQEIGPQNRRYRLERLIGTGGMGQVWQATDLATHAELGSSEMVALKILPPQLTQSATHARLLIEEATQARKLAHENIVRVYEWAQDPATSSYFIIMECLDGEDLEHYLGRQGPLPLAAVQALLQAGGRRAVVCVGKAQAGAPRYQAGQCFFDQQGRRQAARLWHRLARAQCRQQPGAGNAECGHGRLSRARGRRPPAPAQPAPGRVCGGGDDLPDARRAHAVRRRTHGRAIAIEAAGAEGGAMAGSCRTVFR